MKNYAFIVMISVMSTGYAMYSDFPPLERAYPKIYERNQKKFQEELSRLQQLDGSFKLSSKFPKKIKQQIFEYPDQLALNNSLRNNVDYRPMIGLSNKLYNERKWSIDRYVYAQKTVKQVLSIIDEVINKYVQDLKRERMSEWEKVSEIKKTLQIIISAVFGNHQQVRDHFTKILKLGNNNNIVDEDDFSSDEDDARNLDFSRTPSDRFHYSEDSFLYDY